MPAELDYTTMADGVKVANVFSVKQSMWHREGHILEVPPESVKEAVKLIHADYPLEKQETWRTLPSGVLVKNHTAFVVVRTDRNVELGSVGPQYTVVQNIDGFRAALDPMVSQKLLRPETGGVLREGADAFLAGKFNLDDFGPVCREVFADEVVPYAVVQMNHKGRRINYLALTPIRPVCANTLGMIEMAVDADVADEKSVKVKHVGDVERRMVEAAEHLFGAIVERYEAVALSYKALKENYIATAAFRALALYPVIGIHPTRRKGWNPDARTAESVIERYERRRDKITWLWENGAGHTGDHSAWEAYNAVVEAIDHDEDLFPARSGAYRLGSLMDGQLRAKKDAARKALTEYAESDGEEPGAGWIGQGATLVTAK
jgi:phage/plasmid-like protein (TIGR03299 family)